MRRQPLLWRLLGAASLILSTLQPALGQRRPIKPNHDTHDYYVVEHKPSTGAALEDVTRRLGVELVEQVGELEDIWLVRTPKDPPSSTAIRGAENDKVLRAYQSLQAAASNPLEGRSPDLADAARIYSAIAHLEKQELHELEGRAPVPARPKTITINEAIKKYSIEDPYFQLQWHLVNERYPEHMMNVTPVWDMGYTGKGIITALIDDGLDYTAEDLAKNFDAANSYDFNDHEPLPYPKKDWQHHGTRCAGQIAASKDTVCGVGIAHDSKVAGLRILGGKITTVDQATALNYGFQNVHIYSCSWGPRDDGRHMQAPRYIVKKAFLNGITKGRGGKGSVYVFASGNGGIYGDQCNFDGYTNSIYSVTVASLDFKGLHPGYSEQCTANMVVGYSSGSGEHIVTTDRGKNECATSHGGTSAAAPNVAGVFALALQARPDLTWRDIQYLCVETARRINVNDRTWERSSAGRYYSDKYGFGALDASLYVQRALTWKLVPPQSFLETPTIQIDDGTMDYEEEVDGGRIIGVGGVESSIEVTEQMMREANLDKTALEHITVKVWIDHTRRGDVEIEIVSPTGTKSLLAGKRRADEATSGFPGWTFMSVKHWGENPVGKWTIRVSDQQTEADEGAFLGWNMILWGAAIDHSKVKHYEIDQHEKLLPPKRGGTITPMRPEIPNASSGTPVPPIPAATTDETKPTLTANPPHSPMPSNGKTEGNPGSTWMDDVKYTAMTHSWISASFFFFLFAIFALGVYYCCWRRRRGTRAAGPIPVEDSDVPYSALPLHENGDGNQLRMSEMNVGVQDRYVDDVPGDATFVDVPRSADLRRDVETGGRPPL